MSTPYRSAVRTNRPRLRLLSNVAIAVGMFLCLSSLLLLAREAHSSSRDLDLVASTRPLPEQPALPGQPTHAIEPTVEYVEPVYRQLLGRIRVERLGIEAPIRHGAGARVLSTSVGHLPSTALPSSPHGNVVLAAHRDSFFAALKDVQIGDEIELTSLIRDDHHLTRRYTVTGTSVVDETDLSVLDSEPEPTLTLITCYPFHFIGPAPERWIVRAREIA